MRFHFGSSRKDHETTLLPSTLSSFSSQLCQDADDKCAICRLVSDANIKTAVVEREFLYFCLIREGTENNKRRLELNATPPAIVPFLYFSICELMPSAESKSVSVNPLAARFKSVGRMRSEETLTWNEYHISHTYVHTRECRYYSISLIHPDICKLFNFSPFVQCVLHTRCEFDKL